MIELKLKRRKYTGVQTIGTMDIYKDNIYQLTLMTLEQEWKNNKTADSCIPKGYYIVEHYSSNSHPNSFIIQNTEPRTYILIHSGNYNTHTQGCVLVGLSFSDINKDGYMDTIHSKDAMKFLNSICKDEKIISIEIS